MTASSTHDQHVTLTATATRQECGITPTTRSDGPQHEDSLPAPTLPSSFPSQAPAYGATGGSQNKAILIPTDSESESMSESDGETDDEVPSLKKINERISMETSAQSTSNSPALTITTVADTPRALPLGSEVDDHLRAPVQRSPSPTSLITSVPPSQGPRSGSDSSRRSPGTSTEKAEQDHGQPEDASEPLSSQGDKDEPGEPAELPRRIQSHESASQNVLTSSDSDGHATDDGESDCSRNADSASSSDSDGDSDSDDGDYDDDGRSSDSDGRDGCHSKKRGTFSATSSNNSHTDDPSDHNTEESSLRPQKRQKVAHAGADMTPVRCPNSMPRTTVRLSRSPRRPQKASMLSPQASHSLSESESDKGSDCSKASTASFGEWQLQNAALKCLTIDGVPTYQLQFQRMQAHSSSQQSRRLRKAVSSGRVGRSCKSIRFSAAEDRLLNQLKTSGELTWKEIHRQFDEEFPGRRSLGTLQVHYSTKLRGQGKR
ncbi:hypothetical protein ARSEF4850_009742 [Beauveria asiatica]